MTIDINQYQLKSINPLILIIDDQSMAKIHVVIDLYRKRGVRSAECGKCGVWKVRSVESEECGKCGVWKMQSVENDNNKQSIFLKKHHFLSFVNIRIKRVKHYCLLTIVTSSLKKRYISAFSLLNHTFFVAI